MDFINAPDWFNRPEPYAFTLDHLLMVFGLLALGVALAFFLRGKPRKTITIVLICLWAFGATVGSIYYLTIYAQCIIDPANHPFEIEKMLPFHSCLMFIYVFPVAMFVKNKFIKTMACNFLVIINMIIGFITLFVGVPPVGSSVFSFVGMQSLLIHVLIVIVPFIMVLTGYYDIQLMDFKYGLLAFATLGLIMWIFDAITGCDYFYFYDGHTFPVFQFISQNVHHLVWTLIVVSCYVITGLAIHFLIIGVKYLINKQKEKKQNEQQLS
ncbi:MAG: YwaF family protein [Bacilli bacterium]|nr:YwaF family protein [Bacilli bacterium]